MSPRRPIALLGVVACSLVIVPSADAAWERITSSSPKTNTGEVALLRLPDALHMVWRSTTASYRHRIDHRTIAPDGTLGATTTVTEDWVEMSDPALTAGADGLRAIFGGLHTSHPDEINTELNTALSVDGGVSWGLQDGSIVPAGTNASSTPVSAAAQGDGLPLAAWANRLGTWTHRSVDPSVPVLNLQTPLGPFGARPGVATVGSRTVVAWYSASSSARGVYAQEVTPDGTTTGPPVVMPGTSSVRTAMPGRTPVASRVGGKVFVAYAVGNSTNKRILLWSVGSATTRTIARAAGPSVAAVTADPSGRVWVAWTTRSGGRDRVMARRSNSSATSFGDIVDAGRPSSGMQAVALDISAAGGDLDVIAGYTKSGSSRVASWYSRVAP
jgi:hypothetical protein